MSAIRLGLVGGAGRRAQFFLRAATALPKQFEITGAVIRDETRARDVERQFGIRTFRDIEAMLGHGQPSFAVVSVTRNGAPPVLRELAERGMPALCETPPSDAPAELAALHELTGPQGRGAKIQVAEQYQFQPMHAARLTIARDGKLGAVTQAQVSACHGYHGASLIRGLLNVGFENLKVLAMRFTSPLAAGPGRGDSTAAEQVRESRQTIAWLDYGDKLAVYDFTGDQYRSPIRSPRVLVRGQRGEILNDQVKYLADDGALIAFDLRRLDAGRDGNLEGYHHQGVLAGSQWVYRNPVVPGRLSDEEIAVATCMLKMAEYVDGGPAFYDIAEAAQDVYLERLINQAVESGQPVQSSTQPWAS